MGLALETLIGAMEKREKTYNWSFKVFIIDNQDEQLKETISWQQPKDNENASVQLVQKFSMGHSMNDWLLFIFSVILKGTKR